MLDRGDRELVSRDRELIGLRTLLDASAFTELLQQSHPDAKIEEACPYYVRYKPGTSCLVGYHVRAGELRTEVYARCHHPDSRDKATKGERLTSIPSALGPGIVVRPDLNLVIYAFPNDHEIRGLRRMFERGLNRVRVKRLLPDHRALWNGTLTRIRYKPERRCVAKLCVDRLPGVPGEARAVVKLYSPEGFEAALARVNRFANRPGLRLPSFLGAAERYWALAWEWIEGPPLLDVISELSNSDQACERVGAALGDLHRQEPHLSFTYACEDYCGTLEAAAVAIGSICADLNERAQGLSRDLAAALRDHPWRPAPIHGDFSADQVLLSGVDAVFLDLDRAGIGDPLIDLGSLRAKLIADTVENRLTLDRAEEIAAQLVQRYGQTIGSHAIDDLDVFTASSLLQIAPEPFRQRRRDWPAKVEALLAHAERISRVDAAAHSAARRT